ncbi:hypothetical protein [Nocardioides donggukensis]|uniref:Uncharacterized protein n=1 Tax=Nocardioides donggukensis TaxID=2774019 RepID=A0A927K493_9ACTN|nr:hypothetical protein [Nocardioides donggukensis]MBD8869433.1 hypothetical protein [Nocardioides donggukensis]
MRFSEYEMTTALTAAVKEVLGTQRRDVRKGRADIEQVWRDMDRFKRYQVLEAVGSQVLPVLVALPDVEVAAGQSPAFTDDQIRSAVEEGLDEDGGRIRRRAAVAARVALVRLTLRHLPPRTGADASGPLDSP